SEYGADADPRIRSLAPVKFDKSVEYSLAFHQYYLNEMLKRPFCAAAVIWNLADFNSETREETMPHINNKGLLRWNRTPKDLYYYYQAKLSAEPVVAILSRDWTHRAGVAEAGKATVKQTVSVASNAARVTLVHNGTALPPMQPVDGIASWTVDFTNGINELEAIASAGGKTRKDYVAIHVDVVPAIIAASPVPFHSVNILAGAKRMFMDEQTGETWIPDQPYQQGGWGSAGGKPFNQSGNGRLPYGSDKNISGTDNDPVYQTQLVGLSAYRFDVPDGEYDVTLHFAELAGISGASLVYNLSGESKNPETVERTFDVKINSRMFLQDFNMAVAAGPATAIAKRTTVTVSDGKGLVIEFVAKTGEPVLNAIQVRKH
ncbi:MAG: glycoside hydrolase family 2, partial [Chitinophagaceae bacterium]